MPWDNLIRAANKAEARAKIQESTHLDQRCPKGKRPLKMSLNSRDDQAEKVKATLPQAKASPPAWTNQRPPKRSGRKRRKNGSKKSGPGKTLRKIALPSPHQEATPSKLQVVKRRRRLEMPPRLPVIAAIRRAIMPSIALSLRQKKSCSLGNLHVGDCEFEG